MRIRIFCGGRVSTKEQALPRWLIRALTERSNTVHMRMTIGTEQRTPWVKLGKGIGETLRLDRWCHSEG